MRLPLVVAAFVGMAACSQSPTTEGQRKSGPQEIAVEVVEVTPREVEYVVSAVGSVEAFESVQITARVAGVVERVHFKQGDTVKKGALLAEIEPKRYALAHSSAQAALDRVLASRQEAQRELERAQKLVAEGVGTGLDVSQWQTRLGTASAEESQAQAALGLAALNLREARVQAPISGVIQTRNVQTGQYVQAGAVLATLLQRDPLLLRFSVTEEEASRLKPGLVVRFTVKESQNEHEAKVTFVAGAADASSRMVPAVAEVIEPDGAGEEGGQPSQTLRPGSFAEVRAPIEKVSRAIVAPESAVRPSERGFLAYVVEGGVAKERVLTLGMHTRDGFVEVKRGLRPGERVVVRGAEALREGAKVRARVGGEAPGASRGPSGAPSAATGRTGL